MNKPSIIERYRRWRNADGPGPEVADLGDGLGLFNAAPLGALASPNWTAADRAFEAELKRRLGGAYKGFTGQGYANRYGGGFVARTGGRKPSTYVLHHTAGSANAGGASIWAYHVGTRGWDTDGYHVLVSPDGSVEMLIPPSMMSYGAGSENPYTVHVCLHGNYVSAQPTAAARAAIHSVFLALDACYGGHPWRAHRELPNNATVCPGQLLPHLAAMRTAGGSVSPPAPVQPSGPNFGKIVWAMEKAQRILEAEGLTAESAFIAANYTRSAIARRDGR